MPAPFSFFFFFFLLSDLTLVFLRPFVFQYLFTFQNSSHRHIAAEIDFTLPQHPVNKGHLEDDSATLQPALIFDPVSNGSRCESRFVSSESLYYYD